MAAIEKSYDALRYINAPTLEAEMKAVRINEAAIKFIQGLDEEKKLRLLKNNVLVIKYVGKEISKEKIEEVIRAAVSSEEVEEKYVRDFMRCSSISESNENFSMDKVMFIYKYGSHKAKKIAVDEKLRIR